MPKMGDLAAQDNYSAVDWSRMNQPFGTLMDPNPKLYDTKAGPIYQADINQAIDVGMGVSGGGLATKGIKAYHSSPHDFERFDLSKIGTGEGAQVYGHGLYFAENPKVSGQGGQYWEAFKNRFPMEERNAAIQLREAGFDRAKAIESVQRDIDELQRRISPGGIFDKPHMADASRRVQGQIAELSIHRDLLASDKPVGPRTYEVNIKADPAHMLDWDKPIGPTAEKIRELVPDYGGYSRALDPGASGESAYRGLSQMAGKSGASRVLSEAGIPGIKYLDQGSRATVPNVKHLEIEMQLTSDPVVRAKLAQEIEQIKQKPVSSNYVIFDPNIVDIMKKYGIAGAAPAGMGALAAQDTYRGD